MIATWVIQVYLILLKPKGTIESNPSFNRCINQGEVHQLAFCDVMSHTGHRCRNFAGPGVSQRRSRRQASSLYSASQRKWRLNFKWSEDNCCLQRFEFSHFKYLFFVTEKTTSLKTLKQP